MVISEMIPWEIKQFNKNNPMKNDSSTVLESGCISALLGESVVTLKHFNAF